MPVVLIAHANLPEQGWALALLPQGAHVMNIGRGEHVGGAAYAGRCRGGNPLEPRPCQGGSRAGEPSQPRGGILNRGMSEDGGGRSSSFGSIRSFSG